jgi:hypothetical protein
MPDFPFVHRTYINLSDLKPENLLFRTTQEDADIMVADFGLSRIMEEEKLNLLTEVCGTPGVRSCVDIVSLLILILHFLVYGARNIQKKLFVVLVVF